MCFREIIIQQLCPLSSFHGLVGPCGVLRLGIHSKSRVSQTRIRQRKVSVFGYRLFVKPDRGLDSVNVWVATKGTATTVIQFVSIGVVCGTSFGSVHFFTAGVQ